MDLTRLLEALKKKATSAIGGVTSFVKQNPTPAPFVASKARQVLSTPVSQRFQPAAQTLINTNQRVQQSLPVQYYKNRYVEPFRQGIESAAKLTPAYSLYRALQKQPIRPKEQLTNLYHAGVGGLTAIPDLAQDVYMPLADFAKGYSASAIRGGTIPERLKSGAEATALTKPVGFGTAITTDPTKELIGNIAELPLAIGLSHRLAKGEVSSVSSKKIEEATKLFEHELKGSRFVQDITAELSPKTIEKALKDFVGRDITKITDPQELRLVKLANFLDASKKRLLVNKPVGVGLNTQDIRKNKPKVAQGRISDVLVRPDQISPMGRIKTAEIDNVYKKIPDGTTSPDGYIKKVGDKLFPTEKATPQLLKNSMIDLNPDGSIKEGFGLTKWSFTEDVVFNKPKAKLHPTQASKGGDVSKPILPNEEGQLTQPQQLSPPGSNGSSSYKTSISKGVNPQQPFYNIERLNISKEAKTRLKTEVIGNSKATIEKVVGEKLTDEDVIKRAQVISDTLVKTIGRNRTEELAAAQLRLRQNIAKMAEGEVTPELIEAIKTDKSFSANTARLLQKRNIDIEPKSPEAKLKVDMIQKVLSVDDDLEKIVKEANKVDWKNNQSVAEFVRTYIKPNVGDWIDKLRYNSMLSSPSTHIINISSNYQGTAFLYPIQRTIEGAIDAALSAANPKRKRTRFTQEGIEYTKGYYGAIGSAWKKMLSTLTGKTPIENPDIRQIPLATKGIKRVVESTLDSTGKALEAMDQFFKTLTTSGLEAAAQYRQKRGVSSAIDASKQAEELLFRGKLVKEGEGVVSGLLGSGGQWVNGARSSSNPLFRWMAKLSFPFVSIGTNLAKSGIEGNPVLGTLNLAGQKDKIAAVSKLIMGGAVTLGGTMLAASNRMTAWEPTSETKRNAFKKANMLPWAIKVPINGQEQWVQFSKLHPLIGFQLGMVAAINQALRDNTLNEDTAEKIMTAFAGSTKFIADQTYFKNLTDFSNMLNGDQSALTNLLSNYPSQIIPFRALQGWITRIIDQYQRQPDKDAGLVEKVLQKIESQIPGLSQNVPIRKDQFGNPIENPNRFINAVSPARIATQNEPNAKAYERLNAQTQENKIYDLLKNGKTIDFTKTDKRASADGVYRYLQSLEKEERKDAINKLNVPQEVVQEMQIIDKLDRMGFSSEDRDIILLPEQVRARAIYERLSKLKKENRRKKLDEYVKYGIATPQVIEAMRALDK